MFSLWGTTRFDCPRAILAIQSGKESGMMSLIALDSLEDNLVQVLKWGLTLNDEQSSLFSSVVWNEMILLSYCINTWIAGPHFT